MGESREQPPMAVADRTTRRPMPSTDREVARRDAGFPRIQQRLPAPAVLTAALPAVLLLAVILADYMTPAPYYRFLSPLIMAVPALAAATSGVWGAAAFAVLSVATSFLLANLDDRLFTTTFYGGLVGLAVISAISLLPGYQHGRRERKLAQARSVAETVQRAVLIPIPEQIGSLRTAAAYVAAEEEARIGGDLYEALDTPYGVRMIIGDVRGKGLSSVGAAANLLGAFREAAPRAPDLPSLAHRLEESVRRYNARVDAAVGEFITATLLCVPPDPVAQMVSCGHPGPLLIRAGRVSEVQASQPALPLGLGEFNGGGYHVDTIDFDVGDCLLLYTDGVTEARDTSRTFYPLAQRATAWAGAEPEQLIKQVVHDLATHTGGRLGDDAALLASQRRTPAPPPDTPRTDEAA